VILLFCGLSLMIWLGQPTKLFLLEREIPINLGEQIDQGHQRNLGQNKIHAEIGQRFGVFQSQLSGHRRCAKGPEGVADKAAQEERNYQPASGIVVNP